MGRSRIDEMMKKTGVQFGTSGVRGLVAEMTDDVCAAYVTAFLQEAAAASCMVILGHDLRPSSPKIAAACAAAIEGTGRKVLYAGALPTPALAYFAAQNNAPAVVVTGSHIPFDRNGIKFYRATGEISKADETRIVQAVVDLADNVMPAVLPEANPAARHAYIKRYCDFFGMGALAGMRIAVYEHSSVARDILRALLEKLGAQVISLGRTEAFVPIDTEAVRAQDIVQSRQWAMEHEFDAILSTDGDADRPLIGDESGQWLRGDMVGILCAQFLGARVVVTPVSSNTAVEQCGSFDRVWRTRIGSPYVIAAMEEAIAQQGNLVVGYEANGGFLLGNPVARGNATLTALPTRDAVLPMLALLCLARERGCSLSQLTRGLPARYTASDRLQNIPSATSQMLISRIRQNPGQLTDAVGVEMGSLLRTDDTDGLRMTFQYGDVVHLRPSGNAPELRCYTEAASPQRATALAAACLAHISATLDVAQT